MGRGLDGYLISVHWHCAVLKAREGGSRPVSGGYGEGETPLPIPNRAVKPLSADGTWPARAWESRSPPVYFTSNPQRAREEHRMDTLGALFAYAECGGPARSEVGRTLTGGQIWGPASGRIAGVEGGRI